MSKQTKVKQWGRRKKPVNKNGIVIEKDRPSRYKRINEPEE